MSRWGKGISDTDFMIDFLVEIRQLLMKEAAYWFSPEQISISSDSQCKTYWLREALTIIEIMLIFTDSDPDHISLPSFNIQHTAIMRWQNIFFGVWDSELDDKRDIPYSSLAYRVEQRETVKALFDRLSEIAAQRYDLPRKNLQPFPLQGQLPIFSRILRDHRGRFFRELIDILTQRVVFLLSEEIAESTRGLDTSDIEVVWIAVDLIGYLCEKYHASPRVRPRTVHRWLDKVIIGWINFYSDGDEDPIDMETLAMKDGYTNVVATFVRLIDIAQQYPSNSWAL